MLNTQFFSQKNFVSPFMILKYLQIRMSSDIERRVGSLLNNTQPNGAGSVNAPSTSTSDKLKQTITTTKHGSSEQQTDPSNEKLSVELKERQETMQVFSLF